MPLKIGQSVPGLGTLMDFFSFYHNEKIHGNECLVLLSPPAPGYEHLHSSRYRIVTWFDGENEPNRGGRSYNNMELAVKDWLQMLANSRGQGFYVPHLGEISADGTHEFDGANWIPIKK